MKFKNLISIISILIFLSGCSASYKELSKMIIKAITENKYTSDEVSELSKNNIRENYSLEQMCEETLKFYKIVLGF